MTTQHTYQNGLNGRSQTGFSQGQPRGPLDHYQDQRPQAISQVQPRGPLDHYQEQRPQANTMYVRHEPSSIPVYQPQQRQMQNTYQQAPQVAYAPQVSNVRYVPSSNPVAVNQVQTLSPIRASQQPPITKTFSEDFSVPNRVQKIPAYLRQSNSPNRQQTAPVLVRQNSSPTRVIQVMETQKLPERVAHATKQPVDSKKSRQMAEAIYEIMIKEAIKKNIKQAYNSQMILQKEKLRAKQMSEAKDKVTTRGRSSGRSGNNSTTRSGSRSNSGIRNFLGSVFSGKDKGKVFVDGKINVYSENGVIYLKQTFDTFDMNGDKKLEAAEIYASLNKMCPKTKCSMGQVNRLIKEFDTNNDGSIDFAEYKLMVQALQDGKFDDYNSDEEIETKKEKSGVTQPEKKAEKLKAPKDSKDTDLEKLMERNRQLEHENQTLISQSQYSNQSENEQRLLEELAEQQKKEKEMLAMIEDLKRQNLQMSQGSSQIQAPQPIVVGQTPQSQPYQFSASQYQPIGEQYLTNQEAKLAARNQIVSRVPKEQLANQEYCKYLDQRFDYSFNKLKGQDDKIAESQIPELLNDMLSA